MGALARAATIDVRTSAADHRAVRDITGGMARRYARRRTARRGYQAWEVPQCGQATDVETAAWKM